MCFSATASFVTAAITTAVGVAALSRVNEPRAAPLAAMPLLFALQQFVEGLLWLSLSAAPGGTITGGATVFYLMMAEVFWPVFMPVSVYLIEPDARRRHLMLLCAATGIAVGIYLLWWIVTGQMSAVLHDGHIVYPSIYPPSIALGLAYLTATCAALVLSSHRTVKLLGGIILVGSAVAYGFYWEAFASVWCFFAAAASAVILGHFELARRQRLHLAGT